MSIAKRKIHVKQRRMSEIVVLGLLLLCVAGVVAFQHVHTAKTSILAFRISGCTYTNKEDVDSIASKWRKSNDSDLYHLQRSILCLPMVESVVVTKETSSEVSINITERSPYVAFMDDNEIVYLDKHHINIPRQFVSRSADVPVIRSIISDRNDNEARRAMEFGWRIVGMCTKYNVYEYISDVAIKDRTAIMAITGTDAVLLLSESNLERGVQLFKSFIKDKNVNQRFCEIEYLDARYRNQMAVSEKSKHIADTATNQVVCMNAATE